MNRRQLPLAPLMALAAAAAAQPAAALPPSSRADAPVRAERVGDAELARQSGRFLGGNMLVGLRVDLVSRVAAPDGSQAVAQGALLVRRTDAGFEVHVDSRSDASAGSGAASVTGDTLAVGAEGVRVDGIGQVVQIAGDGNRMANLATIAVGGAGVGDPGDFNGATSSSASAGGLTAQVTFLDGGVQLGVTGLGAHLAQQAHGGGAGQVSQLGQIAGSGFVAANTLQLQLMTAAMPALSLQQLGIQQALANLAGLPR